MVIEQNRVNSIETVNFKVKEERRNENSLESFGRVEKVLSHLAYQAPNRVYFDPTGRICRVVLFSENNRAFEAYLETAQFEKDERYGKWTPIKSTIVSCRTPNDLEKFISWWRQQFNMKGDLLENPLSVRSELQFSNKPFRIDQHFVHEAQANRTIYYTYHFTPLGLRESGLYLSEFPTFENSLHYPELTIPGRLLEHIHPFQ